MNYLRALLADNFWQQFGTTEWIYFGVGVVTVIALVVTVILAVKHKKKAKGADAPVVEQQQTAEEQPQQTQADEQPVEKSSEQPAEQPAPVVTEEKPVEKPVEQKQQKKVAVEQPVTQSEIPDEIKKLPHKEVLHRGLLEISYDKSQAAKLMQADEEVRNYYDLIKNELLSYKGVKCRLSWKHESFTKGRVLLAKLKVRGKHLRLLLPLDPNDYVDTKYKVKDLSAKKNHADTPCGYSIKNDRRSVYANDLIATVMQNNGVEKDEPKEFVTYSKEFPYDTTENLIYRKLIKLTYSRAVSGETEGEVHYELVTAIAAEEVASLMTDKEAEQSVEESTRIADKTKTAIINVDVLSKTFEAGEKVTLSEIKKRVPGFSKKTTYIKVLARGVIDKPLTVEADDYSIDAVKMILLTGGTVIRTRKN